MNTATPFRLPPSRIPFMSALLDRVDEHPVLSLALVVCGAAGTFALVAHAMGLA